MVRDIGTHDAMSTACDAAMPTGSMSVDRGVAATVTRLGGEHPWGFVLAGASCGIALGAVARLWMRWISVDPEFSWAGTIGILVSFSVFATAQSIAAVVRVRRARPGVIVSARVGAGLLSAGLFGAAGAMMLPTVVFGSIAVWRPQMRRPIRALVSVLAIPGVVIVLMGIADDHGWGIGALGRMVVFVGIYAIVIAATWATVARVDGGWRTPRRLVLAVLLLGVVAIGAALYLGGVE